MSGPLYPRSACSVLGRSHGTGFGRGASSPVKSYHLDQFAPAHVPELGHGRGDGSCAIIDVFFHQGSPPSLRLCSERRVESGSVLRLHGVVT
jgi:hypothetical protein